ncbi:MAG: QueT transporter family protein [Actinobacteria bacterium]|nr:MAG: QueT transporter family protein [Actinomycetota bacterium]
MVQGETKQEVKLSKNDYQIFSVKSLTRAGLIAALYAALVYLFNFVSFFAFQVRVAEALTVLAYLEPAAVIGLYAGVIIANLASPFGLIDIVFGSFLTLIAAIMTYYIGYLFRKNTNFGTYRFAGSLIGLLPPVLVNAFGVAFIIKLVSKSSVPYWPTVISVAIGQFIAVFILGYPFLQAVFNTKLFSEKNKK